ncbi:hypothetical protein EJ04DRAFT_526242 [Polyplosphaeria fusca]|uniref:Uncharacterized protein n=1 Tax=Polyplosphaeria fusca TaxID=682080 RepID=A0A9P4UZP4_9PLEO|nr:hypothetical protein EJ04DRAFT_526242 [Polyplosphaeria fusca]
MEDSQPMSDHEGNLAQLQSIQLERPQLHHILSLAHDLVREMYPGRPVLTENFDAILTKFRNNDGRPHDLVPQMLSQERSLILQYNSWMVAHGLKVIPTGPGLLPISGAIQIHNHAVAGHTDWRFRQMHARERLLVVHGQLPKLTHVELKVILSHAQVLASDWYPDSSEFGGQVALMVESTLDAIKDGDRNPEEELLKLLRLEQVVRKRHNANCTKTGGTPIPDEDSQWLPIHEAFDNLPISTRVPWLGFKRGDPDRYPSDTSAQHVDATPVVAEKEKPKSNGKRGTGNDQYNKIEDAPGANLPFPHGNITAAEIIAYFPQWLKSWDVVDRLISNHGRTFIFSFMMNEMRRMPKGNIDKNTVFYMMRTACMKRAELDKKDGSRFKGPAANKGKKNGPRQSWSVNTHQAAPDHDKSSLTVTGFRIPRDTHPRGGLANSYNAIVPSILFRDLRRDILEPPTGYDALDLTRCIEYAIQNPQMELLFPDHFEQLVNTLGGPMAVQKEHQDHEVFKRWTTRKLNFLKSAKGSYKWVGKRGKKRCRAPKTLVDDDTSSEIEDESDYSSGGDFNLDDSEDSDDNNEAAHGASTGNASRAAPTPQGRTPQGRAPRTDRPRRNKRGPPPDYKDQDGESPSTKRAKIDKCELVATLVQTNAFDTDTSNLPLALPHQDYLSEGLLQYSELLPSSVFNNQGQRFLTSYAEPPAHILTHAAENIRWARRIGYVIGGDWNQVTDSGLDFDVLVRQRTATCWSSDELMNAMGELNHGVEFQVHA